MRSLGIAYVFHLLGKVTAEGRHFKTAVYWIQLAILNARVKC